MTIASRTTAIGITLGIALTWPVSAAAQVPPDIAAHYARLEAVCGAETAATTAVIDDHSHMSLVFAPNTDDDSVTGPILEWMESVD